MVLKTVNVQRGAVIGGLGNCMMSACCDLSLSIRGRRGGNGARLPKIRSRGHQRMLVCHEHGV